MSGDINEQFNITTNNNNSQQQLNVAQKGGTASMQASQTGGQITVNLEQFFENLTQTFGQAAAEDPDLVPVAREVVPELKQIAVEIEQSPPERRAEVEAAKESRVQELLGRLMPHLPLVMRCTAAFTEAALSTLANKSLVVSGIIAVAGELRR